MPITRSGRQLATATIRAHACFLSCRLPGGHHGHSGGGGGGSWVTGVNTGWAGGANDEDDGHLTFIYLGNNSLPLTDPVRIGTCGMSGRDGPSNTACQASYRYQSTMEPGFYSGTNNGLQQISIQTSGLYRVIAAGARSVHVSSHLCHSPFLSQMFLRVGSQTPISLLGPVHPWLL